MATTNFKGQPVKLIGEFIQVGKVAPDFELVKTDLSSFSLKDLNGKNVILNIFPSLDTSVCATSVRKFNKMAAGLKDTVVLAISKDLPFAHGRFCTTEGIENVIPLSDFRFSDFDESYGVRMADGPLAGLLARAVVVIGKNGKVAYTELVPEITQEPDYDKAIARIPGERAKVAVESYDDRIDPVGACVGMKGSRIHGIVRELRNENIDVINYTSNISLFIQRALSPAKISSIRVNEEEHKAEVYLRPEEVSLAIGKGGLNIKLACMLTEYAIDVFRDVEGADEEDIYLDEFSDEIDSWVIEALKNIGCYTAKSVLAMNREEIVERADLEEQTVDEVLAILSAEFEEEEGEPQE